MFLNICKYSSVMSSDKESFCTHGIVPTWQKSCEQSIINLIGLWTKFNEGDKTWAKFFNSRSGCMYGKLFLLLRIKTGQFKVENLAAWTFRVISPFWYHVPRNFLKLLNQKIVIYPTKSCGQSFDQNVFLIIRKLLLSRINRIYFWKSFVSCF